MAVPKIYRGLLNKNKKRMLNEALMRGRIAQIDKEIYLYFTKGLGKKTHGISIKGLRKLLLRCRINFTEDTLRQKVRNGEISHYLSKVNGKYFFCYSDLDNWLNKLRKRGLEELAKRGLMTKGDIKLPICWS